MGTACPDTICHQTPSLLQGQGCEEQGCLGTGICGGQGCIGTGMQRTAAPCLHAPAMSTPQAVNHHQLHPLHLLQGHQCCKLELLALFLECNKGRLELTPPQIVIFPAHSRTPSSAKPITPVLGSQQFRLWELLPSLPLLATKLQHGQLGAVLRQHAVTLPRKSSC